jgi:arginine-tRNA-protein transferase
MNQTLHKPDRFFFGTRKLPCPYLDGRTERKVVTDLSGPNSADLYERLSRAGFRRSHGLAYRPACPSCTSCVPVRIDAARFEDTASFRRIRRANADLTPANISALATVEQYRLFSRYQHMRHNGGDMSSMTYDDYRALIEDTPVETRVTEYRDGDGALVAAMLADRMEDSLSAVYSFFDPDTAERSAGTYMILWLIDHARELGLHYIYLGYWIEGSPKMSYKERFRPLERLGPDGWSA